MQSSKGKRNEGEKVKIIQELNALKYYWRMNYPRTDLQNS